MHSNYNAGMDDHEAYRLVADLVNTDGAESNYRPIVEALVVDLMERTFNSTDQDEKVRLAHLERRARPILKPWKGVCMNRLLSAGVADSNSPANIASCRTFTDSHGCIAFLSVKRPG